MMRLAPHIAILGLWIFVMYKMAGSQGFGMGGKGGGMVTPHTPNPRTRLDVCVVVARLTVSPSHSLTVSRRSC